MEALELVRDTEPLLPGWYSPGDLPGGASDKEPTQEMQGTWAQLLGREDPLEKGVATHSSILAWRIPWTVKSMGSQRVRRN